MAPSIYGVQGADPEISPITVYADRELTIPLGTSQLTDQDGRAVNKVWIPGAYSVKVRDSNGAQVF